MTTSRQGGRGSLCRKCYAPIKFVKRETGKWMPYNPEELDLQIIDPETLVISAKDGWIDKAREVSAANGPWHLPHWITCPNADEFRKKKEPKKEPKKDPATQMDYLDPDMDIPF